MCRGIKNQTSSNDKKENSAIITSPTNHLKEAKKRKRKLYLERKKAKKRKRQSHENITSAKKSKFEIIGDNSNQIVRSWPSLYKAE